MDTIILNLILLAPLAGALLILLLPDRGRIASAVALITSIFTFLFTLHLPAHFHYGQPGFQFVLDIPWIESPAIHYHVGVDSLSLWLVVLVGLLGPVGVLSSWNAITKQRKIYYSLFLLQQTAMYGVFIALDLMLYYGFWELSLVPMAILIAMFSRKPENGSKTALRFFLFTFIPSAPLLVAILWLYAKTSSFQFERLQQVIPTLSAGALCWVALAFVFAFAVKVPVFPLHGWLADVFSEAPVALAMVVAGKLGLYSMLRFHVGLFPTQAKQIAPLMIALAVIGILYGALLALVQKDYWKLAAFSTMGHLSFVTLGIYGLTIAGLDGAVYQILNHGVSGAALFVLLGILWSRFETSQIADFGGLAAKTPHFVTLFVITTLSLIGLPMFNGFVGEFLILSSSFGVSWQWSFAATIGVILSAAYMLLLVQRIFYGPQSALVAGKPAADLSAREHLVLWPLAVLMLVMGLVPSLWLPTIEQAFTKLTATTTITAGGQK